MIRWVAILFVLMPAAAPGCGACAFAAVDRGLPFAVEWTVLGFVAHVAAAAVLFGHRGRRWGAVVGEVVLLLAALFGTAFVGPLPGFGLLALAAYRLAKAALMSRTMPAARPRLFLGALVVLGVAAVGCAAWGGWRASRRDDADFVLRWSGTAAGRSVFTSLRVGKDLPALRKLVREGAPLGIYESAMAAGSLAVIGAAKTDAPLILEGLRATEATPSGTWMLGQYREALATLLKKRPVTGETAVDWAPLVAELGPAQ